MLIEVADKLFDRLLTLLRERRGVERELFEKYVQPAYADFEALHGNYLGSVSTYRMMLTDGPESLNSRHPIFSRIVEDSIGSQHLRNRLLALQTARGPRRTGRFVQAIVGYLEFSASIADGPKRRRLHSTTEASLLFALDEGDFSERFRSWFQLQLLADGGVPFEAWETSVAATNRVRRSVVEVILRSPADSEPRGRLEPILVDLDAIEMKLQTNHLRVAAEYAQLRTTVAKA